MTLEKRNEANRGADNDARAAALLEMQLLLARIVRAARGKVRRIRF